MKVLRALPTHLFGELRSPEDVFGCRTGELLVLPHSICRHMVEEPGCLCGRAFLGADSCSPVTLAMVHEADEGEEMEAFAKSRLARFWWGENVEAMAGDHLSRMAMACAPFADRQIVRVRMVDSNQLRLYPFALEASEEDSVFDHSSREYDWE